MGKSNGKWGEGEEGKVDKGRGVCSMNFNLF